MSRALLFTLLCCACTPAPRASAQFEFTLAHLGAGPVMGVSGPYDAVFSPGWARVSPDAPLFVHARRAGHEQRRAG